MALMDETCSGSKYIIDIMYCIVSTDLPIIIGVKSRFYCINANYTSEEGMHVVAGISTINEKGISINTELCA
jgi:hypothetical protein